MIFDKYKFILFCSYNAPKFRTLRNDSHLLMKINIGNGSGNQLSYR